MIVKPEDVKGLDVRRRSMLFFRPAFILLLGIVLIFSAFAYGSGLFPGTVMTLLPLQDASPEENARWHFHDRITSSILFSGLVLAFAGCLWGTFRWVLSVSKRRQPQRNT